MNHDEVEIIEAIINYQWRQGAIFSFDAMDDPVLCCDRCRESGALMIVVSQSCDILNDSFVKEPTIVILNAFPIDNNKRNGLYEKGRNPRCYDLCVDNKKTGDKLWHRARIQDHYQVDRKICSKYPPHTDLCLATNEIESLAQWLASRFLRPAFPNNFNNRIPTKRWKNIRKLLEKTIPSNTIPNTTSSSELLSNIFLNVADDELSDTETYHVIVLGTMKIDDYKEIEKRKQITEIVSAITAEIAVDPYIHANGLCRSEQQVTLHDLRSYRKIQTFDDLSYGENN
jgi:hypothetical protein